MKILAIETSCDETAIAIIEDGKNTREPRFSVLAHAVASQVPVHKKWGGVVPNLAKREHQRNLPILLMHVLKEAGLFESGIKNQGLGKHPARIPDPKFLILNSILDREPELLKAFQKKLAPLAAPDIDAIAVTQGPGLEPALWVGVNFARALSFFWEKPLLGINHMEGHILIALLEKGNGNPDNQIPNPKRTQLSQTYNLKPITFPAISLLVSGGHTEIVLMKKAGTYEVVGETRDDAAGEAFDKVARILDLPYPGGPQISALAEKKSKIKDPGTRIKLPRPMFNSTDLDFSFSGLKTAVLYLVRDLKKSKRSIAKLRPAIAKEFQNAAVDVLVKKAAEAIKKYKAKTFILGGGVAANKELRERLLKEISLRFPSATCYLPSVSLTGDNGLMIASAAYLKLLRNKNPLLKQKNAHSTALMTSWKTMRPDANMGL